MSTSTNAELRSAWSRRDHSTKSMSLAAIRILADGQPATPEALMAATGMTMDEVAARVEALRLAGAEVESGAVVGEALTLRPTEHRFRIRGHDLYTWCGFDALFVPIIVGERAEVASACPVTGADIRMTVEADGTVSAVTPADVVGIVGEEVTSCCDAAGPGSEICAQMPFFASRDVGERWRADHPGVAIVDLDDAREIARAYVEGSGS